MAYTMEDEAASYDYAYDADPFDVPYDAGPLESVGMRKSFSAQTQTSWSSSTSSETDMHRSASNGTNATAYSTSGWTSGNLCDGQSQDHLCPDYPNFISPPQDTTFYGEISLSGTDLPYTGTDLQYTETDPQYTEADPQYTEADPQYTETDFHYTGGATDDYIPQDDVCPVFDSIIVDVGMAARQASEQALAALQNSQPVDCVFVTDEKIRRRAPKRRAERERKAIREVLFECLHEFFLDGTQPPENAMTILQEGAYQLALRIKRDDSSDDEAFQFCFNLLGFCLEAVKQELRCPGSGAAQAAYDTVDKGKHPCTFPGCRGKSYTRQADLARHMASHQEGDKSYYCDYRKCARKDSPFSRQDHFRDHIRDQHLEDLPVRGKPSDARWWSERNNKPMIERWWRCNKCLTHRVSIDVDGYVCSKCGNACELERQKFRHKWDVTQGRQ